MSSNSPDVIVAGGGIVGLATAMRLLQRLPRLRLLLLEKEASLATQQTGHNSGVLHAGVYYAPGSMKARFCVAGRKALLEFCAARGIPVRVCGKLIVASHASELTRLDELFARARANGVEDVRMLEATAMREIEPHVAGVRALHVPSTAVVDFRAVAQACADEVRAAGGEIRVSCAVLGLQRRAGSVIVRTNTGEIETKSLISCCGLYADRLAEQAGAPRDLRIVPFRGDYYAIRASRAHLCRALIYPVPDPRFPFLGVHFTRTLDGTVLAGPNAVLAFARQGYERLDLNPFDLAETLRWPGFWRMAARYWRTGIAEMWRDYSRHAYVQAMQAYLPALTDDDVLDGPSGVRAQGLRPDGQLLDDFSFFASEGVLAVRNAPSPAATSSLALADAIVDEAQQTLSTLA